MTTNANLQHLPHDAPSAGRPGEARFGAQSRRVLEDLKVLGSIALVRSRVAARELREQGARALGSGTMKHSAAREWTVGLVRAHPLKSMVVVLGLGYLLGYLLHRR